MSHEDDEFNSRQRHVRISIAFDDLQSGLYYLGSHIGSGIAWAGFWAASAFIVPPLLQWLTK